MNESISLGGATVAGFALGVPGGLPLDYGQSKPSGALVVGACYNADGTPTGSCPPKPSGAPAVGECYNADGTPTGACPPKSVPLSPRVQGAIIGGTAGLLVGGIVGYLAKGGVGMLAGAALGGVGVGTTIYAFPGGS